MTKTKTKILFTGDGFHQVPEVGAGRILTHIHATDIRGYLDCRRRFYYDKILRIKPVDSKEPEYFDFGKKGHRVLQAHYNSDSVDEVLESIDNAAHKQALRSMYKLYVPQWEEEDKKYQIASADNSMVVLFEGVEIYFTIDLLALDTSLPKPFYVVLDHKFYSRMPDERILDKDFQPTFYLWGLNKINIRAKKFILNVIKKEIPLPPQPLKKGGLSRSKAALDDTEYDLYLQSIHGFGLNPADYKEELDYLLRRGSSIFKRIPTGRTDRELETFEEDLRYIIREIRDKNTRFVPTPGLDCPRCPFTFLCKVHSASSEWNYQHTRKTMYTQKSEDER